eukprot:428189-Hanusia_phi.AAC.2
MALKDAYKIRVDVDANGPTLPPLSSQDCLSRCFPKHLSTLAARAVSLKPAAKAEPRLKLPGLREQVRGQGARGATAITERRDRR